MRASGLFLVCALVATTGCRFEHHESSSDKKGDVKFNTPFGGVSVKNDSKSALAGVGLTPYPGAVLETKSDNGDEDSAADVNFSFGGIHVGVKVLNYRTADAEDKVLAFYRKDMAKYGTVILCHGKSAVGQPTRTQDGLACDSDSSTGKNVNFGGDDAAQDNLKAGSRQHQHVVNLQPGKGGTKIALVMLDLPGKLTGGDSTE